ncbi:surface protease GP63, putative [Trypanosoma cruzi marinkellei]|uniref:Leishmanolysin-like peptidase n=1 Tax=Trypanosoma cruzi marinkellei TaxID=85056 RepID=K2NQY2_TRYCR|nr:surface protease GP63, putative [Trypanosoma cruzi marinkellei]
MISELQYVRGKSKVTVISSPKVKEMVRSYYNCPRLEGMELEDEGGKASVMSHWKKRSAVDELMSSDEGIGYYSVLTLAAFEDMGVYKANYDMAEILWWGNNSGCGLLEKKCLTEGITDYPELFCNKFPDDTYKLCTYDRLSLGSCNVKRYNQPLPAEYQYFANPKLGGALKFMDKCPFVDSKFRIGCTNAHPDFFYGSFIGPKSRCVKGQGLQLYDKQLGDVCVNTQCNDGTLSVQFLLDDTWHVCKEGETVAPAGEHWSGSILCPKYDDVCTDFPNISSYPIPVVDPPLADDSSSSEGSEEESKYSGSSSSASAVFGFAPLGVLVLSTAAMAMSFL